MSLYARVSNGIVAEIVTLPSEISPSDAFHPDVAITLVECNAEVKEGWTYAGDAFAAPAEIIDLEELKAARTAMLTATCAAAIIGGYSSSALGSPHVYPSRQTDQINMMGSVTAALLPGLDAGWSTPFWCADASGDWAFRAHSAEQIRQAGQDGKAHVVNCQTMLATLTAEVEAAETAEAIAAIVWSNS